MPAMQLPSSDSIRPDVREKLVRGSIGVPLLTAQGELTPLVVLENGDAFLLLELCLWPCLDAHIPDIYLSLDCINLCSILLH